MSPDQRESSMTEAEVRYRHLRDSVADYHYHVRVERGRGMVKVHGPRCESFTGYRADEFAANPDSWNALVVEEDRATVARQTAKLLDDRDAPPVEYRMRRADGRVLWIEKSVVPYCDEQGKLIAYDALLRDVTPRKEAERALRESEARYRLLFEDDLTGNYVATPSGDLLLCNRAFARIFGIECILETGEVNIASLYDDSAAWTALVERLQQEKSIERHCRATRRSDGTLLHIIENVVGSFDEQGRLARVKGYLFDNTDAQLESAKLREYNTALEEAVRDRTRAEREQRQYLHAVLNSAFDAIITMNDAGIIQSVNRAAERMFGYDATEMIGQKVNLLMPSHYRDEHDEYLDRYARGGQKRILDAAREVVALRKDGTIFPVELSVTEVEPRKIFTGILHDISERKELQTHVLRIAEDEQRRIGLELHDGVGQELTGLALYAGTLVELLEAVPTPRARRDRSRRLDEGEYDRIMAVAKRLSERLSEANRHIQQLAHGVLPVQIEPDGLQSALDELAVLADAAGQARVRFSCPGEVTVSDNRTATHLYRIAQEALNNALRHSRASEIVISLRRHGDQVTLAVSDNGVGVETDSTHLQPSEEMGSTRENETGDSNGNKTIDTEQGSRRPLGMGLKTMRYRCGLVSGDFRLESLAQGGTVVSCVVRSGGENHG